MNDNKKIIGYDANTGAPIYEERKILRYDANTGEPIYEEEKKILRFNTETGAPIYEKTEDNVIGYNPNTGEPIYSGSENLMTDKKNRKVIGYDPNTGFPIYEYSNVVNNGKIEKVRRIKMTSGEKATLIVSMIIAFFCFFFGLVHMISGIIFGSIMFLFAIISPILYLKQVKKKIVDYKSYKLSSGCKIRFAVLLFIFAGYFLSYISLLQEAYDMEGPGAGFFALLILWPSYIFLSALIITTSVIFSNKVKKDIRNYYNL